MNILITGGLGYIGGRLADYLKRQEPDTNIYITAIDKSVKIPSWAKEHEIIPMNLLDEGSIENCFKTKIDIIIHLSALNEIQSMRDPELALEVNTRGTYKLLNSASRHNVKRVIYFSTFHAYGSPSVPVITEETPARPFHPYASTHRAAEDIVDYFFHYKKMNSLIFRLSNGYGYPMNIDVERWTLVFNDLCRQAVTTGKIVLNSSGKQHRDFISLNNAARAVHHFIFKAQDKWSGNLYNLGGENSMSVLDVANKIAGVYKSRYKKDISGIEVRPDEKPAEYRPVKYSIEKLKKTGFSLKEDTVFEIEKTMELCEEFRI